MALAIRIIPCLDVKDGRVVKGTHFVSLRDAGDPVELAAAYSDAGADEIVFLDITASAERRATVLDVVRRTAERVFVPLTVGGGLRTVDDVRSALRAGADKVSVNSAAVRRPELVREAADAFGSQCVVVAVDARRVEQRVAPRAGARVGARWEVVIDGGRTPTGLDVLDWIERVQTLGAGEILLTSMNTDGTQAGYDNELNAAVAGVLGIPLIASGGAGSLADLYDAVTVGHADALLVASMFHYGTHTVREAKEYLAARGLPVRL